MDALGIVLAPVFYLVTVRPIAWLIYKLMPDGKLKTALFRVRGPQ